MTTLPDPRADRRTPPAGPLYGLTRTVPAAHLTYPEVAEGIEARMVGELASSAHEAGRVFEDWPQVTRHWVRWPTELEAASFGSYVRIPCAEADADLLELHARVVTRPR